MERFEKGKIQLSKGNYREAEKLFGQAMYYDSSASLYHFYQGMAMVRRQAYAEAQWAFERACLLEPENADYSAELGFVCLELGVPGRAMTFFRTSLMNEPCHKRATEGMRRLRELKDFRRMQIRCAKK